MFTDGNLTIMVSDFERSLRFYTETLGLALKFRAGNEWAEVAAPGVSIGLHPAGGHAPTGAGGGMSLGLQVSDIESAIETLEGRGVEFPRGWRASGAWPTSPTPTAHSSTCSRTPPDRAPFVNRRSCWTTFSA
jgi:catechol 2,3-dioxygenase-like lactoylglutathione lyase family enzyme